MDRTACRYYLFVWGFTPYQQYSSYSTVIVHKSVSLTIFFTSTKTSQCYSHNHERQGGKPLPPVLKALVCRGRGSNPRPPAHEADSLTTRPPRRLQIPRRMIRFLLFLNLEFTLVRFSLIIVGQETTHLSSSIRVTRVDKLFFEGRGYESL